MLSAKIGGRPYKPVPIYQDGMLFMYTQPRHQLGHYCFQDIATRKKSRQRKFLNSLQKRKGLLHKIMYSGPYFYKIPLQMN